MILASGGFGADFGSDSLLATYRPDLLHLPTTNGEHCTGGQKCLVSESCFFWGGRRAMQGLLSDLSRYLFDSFCKLGVVR